MRLKHRHFNCRSIGIGGLGSRDRGKALTSRLQTFETEMLAKEENFAIN